MSSKESLRALVGIIQEKIEELGSNNPSDEVEKLIKSKLESFLEKQGYVSKEKYEGVLKICLLYTSPSPRDISGSRMPSSA